MAIKFRWESLVELHRIDAIDTTMYSHRSIDLWPRFLFFVVSCHNQKLSNNIKKKCQSVVSSEESILVCVLHEKFSGLTFDSIPSPPPPLANWLNVRIVCVWKLKWKYQRHDLAGGIHESDWYVRHTCCYLQYRCIAYPKKPFHRNLIDRKLARFEYIGCAWNQDRIF